MNDEKIIDLYFKREEAAIVETDRKYGNYCRKIAWNILALQEDVEECINDTYLHIWNSIPPQLPRHFSGYLGKICRNTALKLYEKLTASKRGGGQIVSCLEELEEITGNSSSLDEQMELTLLASCINHFLAELPKETRIIFVKRYFEMDGIKDIAAEHHCSESKIKMSLKRSREKLKDYLKKEGYHL